MTTSAPTTILRTVDKPRLRVIGEPIPTPRRPPNEQLRPREFLTAQEEPAIFALSRACIARGTGSSNPSPSSAESANYRFRAGLPTLGSDRQQLVGLSLVPCGRRATCGRGRHLGSFRPKLISASPHYPPLLV